MKITRYGEIKRHRNKDVDVANRRAYGYAWTEWDRLVFQVTGHKIRNTIHKYRFELDAYELADLVERALTCKRPDDEAGKQVAAGMAAILLELLTR